LAGTEGWWARQGSNL